MDESETVLTSSLPYLRRIAREIFDEALARTDAGRAIRRAVSLQGSRLNIVDANFDLEASALEIYVIALGKAAGGMALALEEILGDRINQGVISAPPCESKLSDRWRVFAGGHPVPNASSLEAARAAFELLETANRPSSLIIFLVSGGGSAMLEWPRDARVTLDDMRATNQALVSCGASIAEINSVRRHLSAVKGGELSGRAPLASQLTLIISDTQEGRASDVASGPSLPPPADEPSLARIMARYDLASRVPARVARTLERAGAERMSGKLLEAPRSEVLRRHYVLLDNARAMECAAESARARGFAVELARDLVEQDVAEGARALVERLFDFHRRGENKARGKCLISGGEFSCPVLGAGTGGRNAETALRCAFEFAAQLREQEFKERGPRNVVALCAGTDGIDGNSPAAGAISDHTTLERARARELEAAKFLAGSDAYTFFNALGDSVLTGPTGTNVRDLRILLAL